MTPEDYATRSAKLIRKAIDAIYELRFDDASALLREADEAANGVPSWLFPAFVATIQKIKDRIPEETPA